VISGRAPAAAEETRALLPTVALGPSRITQLIVGGDPLYGYSHFNARYSQHMLEWFTDERVVKFLLDCEKPGSTPGNPATTSESSDNSHAFETLVARSNGFALLRHGTWNRVLPALPQVSWTAC